MAAKSFKFFASFLEAAELLPEKDRGNFLYAVAKYGIEGVEIPLKRSLQSHWALIKPNLDTSRKYQSYGEKGGRPQKPPLEKSESPFWDFEKPDKDMDTNKDRDGNMNGNEDVSSVCDSKTTSTVFSSFSGGDEPLRKALSNYDAMRSEQGKPLTDTQRRCLCQQLDSEFQPCEWVQIIEQSTRRGWLQFFPLDKCQTVPKQEETITEQLDRVLKSMNSKGGFYDC